MIKETYVEISGRRSGKTTRLIAAAKDWQLAGGKALIVTFNLRVAKTLYKGTGIEAISTFMLKNWLMERGQENLRIFYDEFDLMTDWWPIIEGDYYVATPQFIRKRPYPMHDKLLRLVALVGSSNVVNYRCPVLIKEFKTELTRTEMYGTWQEKPKGFWTRLKDSITWWSN